MSKIDSAASEEKSFENVNGRTHGRTDDGRKVITIAHPEHSSGELIKVREHSTECHNHKPQSFLRDTKRKRKQTKPNKRKSNKRTKSIKISSLFPKRGNRKAKRTGKHKNKTTQRKTKNKSPRRTNHKATKSKTNTGTTAFERSVE